MLTLAYRASLRSFAFHLVFLAPGAVEALAKLSRNIASPDTSCPGSNDVDNGPDRFSFGQPLCNTGDMDATSATADLEWQDANARQLCDNYRGSGALGTILALQAGMP